MTGTNTAIPNSETPNIKLNNGVEIPQFGLGVFQIPLDETEAAVLAAFEAGYRHIDTAQMYANEEGVGRAVTGSGLSRDEVFVTTKLNNDKHGEQTAVNGLDESLRRLGLDHVDLFLIHWPLPHQDRYVETWRGLERALEQGKTRAIGVSNFQIAHLDRLAAETGTVPAVNQIELHPRFAQAELRGHHERHGIATEAWSPIGQGESLNEAAIGELARRYGRTPAQVILRWHIQHGNIVFPKSAKPERMRENISVFDFALADRDMATIDGLEAGGRIGPDPDTFGS